MDRMSIDDTIVKALETWYEKDHPLHLDPLHPAIALAGEAGELLDLYKKEKFKDGVSWWDCICGHSKKYRRNLSNSEDESCIWFLTCPCETYTPKILDELGDLWYYLRILAYQLNANVADFTKYYHENKAALSDATILIALTNIMHWSSRMLHDSVFPINVPKYRLSDYPLVRATFWLLFVLREFDYTLPELTELNHQKLRDGDNNGWKEARLAKRRNSISSNED